MTQFREDQIELGWFSDEHGEMGVGGERFYPSYTHSLKYCFHLQPKENSLSISPFTSILQINHAQDGSKATPIVRNRRNLAMGRTSTACTVCHFSARCKKAHANAGVLDASLRTATRTRTTHGKANESNIV